MNILSIRNLYIKACIATKELNKMTAQFGGSWGVSVVRGGDHGCKQTPSSSGASPARALLQLLTRHRAGCGAAVLPPVTPQLHMTWMICDTTRSSNALRPMATSVLLTSICSLESSSSRVVLHPTFS
jgi:hypothetical protein